jgi:hypothetical protein
MIKKPSRLPRARSLDEWDRQWQQDSTKLKLTHQTHMKTLMDTLLKTLHVRCLAAILAGSLAILSGCGGGGATYKVTGDKTLGQELQDLQQSYEKGIITQKQYEDSKKDLIKKYTEH